MTREYARVRVSIWADSDFRKLTWPAQALYFQLLSSPTMNLCGVADWRPKRLAALTHGIGSEDVESAAKELAEDGYVIIDEETEEILVRSFVRHDGLIKTPNIAAAMAKDYAGVASASIRGVIIHELNRLHDDEPEMKGWATASKLLSEPSINPSGIASVNPSGMALPIPSRKPSGNGSHIPQPASINQQPASSSTKSAATRTKVAAPDPESETAQTLIADWINGLKARPPGQVVGQVAKLIGAMLGEGIPADDIKAGIEAWQLKGLHPSTLPSVVHEIRNQPRAATSYKHTADKACPVPGHENYPAHACAGCRTDRLTAKESA